MVVVVGGVVFVVVVDSDGDVPESQLSVPPPPPTSLLLLLAGTPAPVVPGTSWRRHHRTASPSVVFPGNGPSGRRSRCDGTGRQGADCDCDCDYDCDCDCDWDYGWDCGCDDNCHRTELGPDWDAGGPRPCCSVCGMVGSSVPMTSIGCYWSEFVSNDTVRNGCQHCHCHCYRLLLSGRCWWRWRCCRWWEEWTPSLLGCSGCGGRCCCYGRCSCCHRLGAGAGAVDVPLHDDDDVVMCGCGCGCVFTRIGVYIYSV